MSGNCRIVEMAYFAAASASQIEMCAARRSVVSFVVGERKLLQKSTLLEEADSLVGSASAYGEVGGVHSGNDVADAEGLFLSAYALKNGQTLGCAAQAMRFEPSIHNCACLLKSLVVSHLIRVDRFRTRRLGAEP